MSEFVVGFCDGICVIILLVTVLIVWIVLQVRNGDEISMVDCIQMMCDVVNNANTVMAVDGHKGNMPMTDCLQVMCDNVIGANSTISTISMNRTNISTPIYGRLDY
jgi:hypothetical protein